MRGPCRLFWDQRRMFGEWSGVAKKMYLASSAVVAGWILVAIFNLIYVSSYCTALRSLLPAARARTNQDTLCASLCCATHKTLMLVPADRLLPGHRGAV